MQHFMERLNSDVLVLMVWFWFWFFEDNCCSVKCITLSYLQLRPLVFLTAIFCDYLISHDHLCDLLSFLVLWINVLCCWIKGWLILPISFMLFSDIVIQLTKTWILKLTPPWMLKYLIILSPLPFTFNLFFRLLIFSSLTVSHPIRT